MKRSDIAMIILIAGVSILTSYIIARAIFGDVRNEKVNVKTTQLIKSEVAEPNPNVFNKQGINPTVEVFIGGQKP